jgi:hypothetical protein
VYENAKITAQNECAIMGYQSVLVRNNAVVEAKNNAIAIYIYTEGGIIEKGHVEMSDNAQVIAAHNYDIQSTDDIFIYPEFATAYWDTKEGKHGIERSEKT